MRPVPSVLDLISRRLALPRSQGGLIGTERVLASVRVVLALSSLLLLRLKPEEAFPYHWALGLVVAYFAHSVGLLVLFWWRGDASPRLRLVVHAGDILCPAVIGLFGIANTAPFVLYFIF